jgi:hypothetical protein
MLDYVKCEDDNGNFLFEEPLPKDKIDWSSVMEQVFDHMNRVFNPKCGVRDDEDHYIFEAVITAMYGKEIWKAYNKALSTKD